MLQELTEGDLRTEIMFVMFSSSSGGAGELTIYLALVNSMLRVTVDEAALATQVQELTLAQQADGEDELAFAERGCELKNLCSFLYAQAVVKSRSVEGLNWSVHMENRKPSTSPATVAGLVRFEYCHGDECRNLREEQRQERQGKLAEEKKDARKARDLPEEAVSISIRWLRLWELPRPVYRGPKSRRHPQEPRTGVGTATTIDTGRTIA